VLVSSSTVPAPATKLREVLVGRRPAAVVLLQLVAIELRVSAAPGVAAHVRQDVDTVVCQDVIKLFKRARAVADGEDSGERRVIAALLGATAGCLCQCMYAAS
jgi:hypothetical protein